MGESMSTTNNKLREQRPLFLRPASCLLSCLFTCLLACLLAYLLAYLLVYLIAYFALSLS